MAFYDNNACTHYELTSHRDGENQQEKLATNKLCTSSGEGSTKHIKFVSARINAMTEMNDIDCTSSQQHQQLKIGLLSHFFLHFIHVP